MITEKNQKILLSLARESIKTYLESSKKLSLYNPDFEPEIKNKQGTFVTLKINHHLRGCIGHIMPIQPIYQDIISNAFSAAFEDPRFATLSKEELTKTNIEISVLSPLKPLLYIDAEDLLKKIKIGTGIVIKAHFHSAVFLPQVWDELPQRELFLSHLCLKAGLSSNFWQKNKLEIQTFEVQKFSE